MGRTLADIWKRVTEVRGDRWLFQEEVATIEVKLFCKKCGKEPPVDEKRSNGNWSAYNTSRPCECGGAWGLTTKRLDGEKHD